jgi:2-polyprenyl-3-methyl-5-hydroxy-6-metoxy-1,4-benzoquinol methylase
MTAINDSRTKKVNVLPTDEEALRFWGQVVDPRGIGMPAAIAGELASYTGESVEEVLRKMDSGKDDLKKLWEESAINAEDSASVVSFYRNQIVEAYELANWHCGRTNGNPPLNYARAALFARANGLVRALDFGSGVGTGSLCLAEAGCETYSADIAEDLLKIVDHRMKLRGFQSRTIDLEGINPLPRKHFDIITCFDVLEHVPDQLNKVKELCSYLRNGGYLFINFMKDSYDEGRPMHISSADNWIALVRQTTMLPVWSATNDQVKVLRKSRVGRLRNVAANLASFLKRHP